MKNDVNTLERKRGGDILAEKRTADWTAQDVGGVLKLINLASGGLAGRIRLQKLIFIAKKEKDISYPFSFEFIRYHFGPYSKSLQDLLAKLVSFGLVQEHLIKTSNDRDMYLYRLTSNGKELLNRYDMDSGLAHQLMAINKLWLRYRSYNQDTLVLRAKELFGW